MSATDQDTRPAVLVVEDEFWIMQDVSDTLAEHGYHVLCASRGDEALAVVEGREDILVIFTDINMPGGLDGLALAREVRRRRPEVGLIVTSGRVRGDDLDLPDEGVFIPKPYHPKVVLRNVGKVLGGSDRGRSAAGIAPVRPVGGPGQYQREENEGGKDSGDDDDRVGRHGVAP